MNNLEKEILDSIPDYDTAEFTFADQYNELIAKAAASVAMKWIEKAFNDSVKKEPNGVVKYREFTDWQRENVLTPTEPDTKEPLIGSNGIADPGPRKVIHTDGKVDATND